MGSTLGACVGKVEVKGAGVGVRVVMARLQLQARSLLTKPSTSSWSSHFCITYWYSYCKQRASARQLCAHSNSFATSGLKRYLSALSVEMRPLSWYRQHPRIRRVNSKSPVYRVESIWNTPSSYRKTISPRSACWVIASEMSAAVVPLVLATRYILIVSVRKSLDRFCRSTRTTDLLGTPRSSSVASTDVMSSPVTGMSRSSK